MKKYVLGIDTSNYKTSVAVCAGDEVICDVRRFLQVKQGERGLRQSDALFQHVKALPELMNELRESFDGEISAVAYSSRPRPVEGSYMPVFLAGQSVAESVAEALKVPAYAFSHQEGHIEAVRRFCELRDTEEFLACHFSGGTTEVLHVKPSRDRPAGFDIDIVGGTRDIAFGQLIDRVGVAMGMKFPAGEYLDRLALSANHPTDVLTAIKVQDAYVNLSGIDTQIRKHILSGETNAPLARELFMKINLAVSKMVEQAREKTGISDVLMAGGVSSSMFVRDKLTSVCYGKPELSGDNAVGIALLGGRNIWD